MPQTVSASIMKNNCSHPGSMKSVMARCWDKTSHHWTGSVFMLPGGRAAYPSSVLMNAIPAKVAGVSDVVMVVPTPDGIINEMVLAAAALAGVDRVFTIGGAQAVAALAWGNGIHPESR